jgi:hypothetical protein
MRGAPTPEQCLCKLTASKRSPELVRANFGASFQMPAPSAPRPAHRTRSGHLTLVPCPLPSSPCKLRQALDGFHSPATRAVKEGLRFQSVRGRPTPLARVPMGSMQLAHALPHGAVIFSAPTDILNMVRERLRRLHLRCCGTRDAMSGAQRCG